MNSRLAATGNPPVNSTGANWMDRVVRHLVLSRLKRIEIGQLVISEGGEHTTCGQLTRDFPLTGQLQVLDPRFYRAVAFGGSIGAGEAYMKGYWDSVDLGTFLRIMIRNRDVLRKVNAGLAWLGLPLQLLLHLLNKNTRRGSRKNIAAHYDLGNDFYELWLDRTMMYSSAYFDAPDTPLEDASIEKLDRICRKLQLTADDAVLEIGTGWGGFALHAAKHYGCHVTTTTISEQQFNYAKRAVKDAGLEDRITLLCKDYRDLEGQFDKLVSIEMIEAVGYEYHSTYFRKCCELLKRDGLMLLQSITMGDQEYNLYKRSTDFIRRYIFPGGCLTSLTDMTKTMTRHTDLRTIHIEDIGPHYATTLRHWHDRFMARLDELYQQGFSATFVRMWQFYLISCESAFIERKIGNVQMVMMRPAARLDHVRY